MQKSPAWGDTSVVSIRIGAQIGYGYRFERMPNDFRDTHIKNAMNDYLHKLKSSLSFGNREKNKMLYFYFQRFKPQKVAGFAPKSVLFLTPKYLLAGFAPKSDLFASFL